MKIYHENKEDKNKKLELGCIIVDSYNSDYYLVVKNDSEFTLLDLKTNNITSAKYSSLDTLQDNCVDALDTIIYPDDYYLTID